MPGGPGNSCGPFGFHLHYVAGRAEERLTFDMQPVVGARLGYTRHGKQDGVERFMRHYFLIFVLFT